MDTTAILQQLIFLDTDRIKQKPAAREQMLAAAQALVTSLQTPSEFISCTGWAEPARSACVRTAVDLKIFDILGESGGEGVPLDELAKISRADPALLARMMKHLAAVNVVSEPGQDRYAHTQISSQFTEPKFRDGIVYCYDVAGPVFRDMPAYFSKASHKQPLDPIDGPFQFAHKTKDHFFPWLAQNPTYLSAFGNYMAGYRDGKRPWFSPDFYPVQKQLIEGFDTSASPPDRPPFLVDVGGGKGHDILALASSFSDLPGDLVLQDKPEVISSIDPPLQGDMQAMAHDFFKPQPAACHGARAYFLHSVLHDWDDDSCIKILSSLKSALIPGYSKVLVHDLIVPNKGASWSVTSMDWLMMALGSVRERTEADFRRLFEAAGLEIQKIWVYDDGTEGVIEAVLPL